ncbi:MAG TPA: hypothetical protein VFH54_15390, partial [Mycobacteriales bacterium]|nr:hypothetical protein [Mycobacteriales bacterium]
RAASDAQSACDQLIDLALRAGGPDNVTAIVADVVDEDVEEEPILGGAAADAKVPAPAAEDTPATRAARMGRRHRAVADDSEDGEPAKRRRGRLPLVIAIVLILIIAGVIGAWLYARSQYYVASTGNPPVVAVYQGIGALSHVDARTDIPLAALPEDAQNNIRNHIDVGSKHAAGDVVRRLRAQACPTPTATASPAPSAASPTPAVTPSPTPTYCNG